MRRELPLVALFALVLGCKKDEPSTETGTERSGGTGSAATEADCSVAMRPASLWLVSRQLGDNQAASGSDVTASFRAYAESWHVRGAFSPWCLGRTDVIDTPCFTGDQRRTPACEELQGSLLSHRVYGPACVELLTSVAPLVLAQQELGGASHYTEARMTAFKEAEARYRGPELAKLDVPAICSKLGGVRVRCLVGHTSDECNPLIEALRAPFPPR